LQYDLLFPLEKILAISRSLNPSHNSSHNPSLKLRLLCPNQMYNPAFSEDEVSESERDPLLALYLGGDLCSGVIVTSLKRTNRMRVGEDRLDRLYNSTK
jgi:hypothetical protein